MEVDVVPINKEGYNYIFSFAFATIVLLAISYWLLALGTLFFALFFLYFFRDPERKIPNGKNIIVAPADGKIVEISENKKEKSLRIFLSPLNVHINRAPISGKITYIELKHGKFKPAYKKTLKENKENHIIINSKIGKITVVQIVGFLARRICCWVDEGADVKIGERIGMIKFGSSTRLIMSANVKLEVKIGDKVRAGETIIARYLK